MLNFFFIETSLALGTGFWPVFSKKKKHYAWMISQVLVGGYLFFGLGLGLIYLSFGVIVPENMQIEGFWMWLLSGTFAGSVLHYLIVKIFGPLIFNRGCCAWVCWTAAVLDLLPWKQSSGPCRQRMGISSLCILCAEYGAGIRNKARIKGFSPEN
ncbi:hypothetical protein [Desulfitibacter alkalitolerans]|uniref:hypothetical protein n=1 Tax=Desulfitibacter alkalitolerans TaxID=264641 RepID=UPI000685211A|nr:hypothetical protein [Desulfitibacter alkalitolerans]